MKSYLKDTHGQAMIEFLICIPLLLTILFGIINLSNLLIYKEKTVEAVRYGALHLLRNGNENDKLGADISKNFFDNKPNVLVQTDTKGSDIENHLQGTIDKIFKESDFESESLHIKVECPISSPLLSKPVLLSDESYIKGNSWNGYDVKTHDILDMIINIAKKPIDILF